MAGAWRDEETRALVGVWGAASVQEQLDGVVRNRIVYEYVAKMVELGYERTWQQCRTKIKNMTQRYRKVHISVCCCYVDVYACRRRIPIG